MSDVSVIAMRRSFISLYLASPLPLGHYVIVYLLFKVPMKRHFFISLFERAFKMMKDGVYFIVIALLVAKLFKVVIYGK